MELNGYTLAVRPGTEDNGYVELEHNTQYSVFLINDNETRCDATLTIDGIKIGTWRIEAEDSIKLERGVADKGRFTFYKLGSKEGSLSGLRHDKELGLIKCQFLPEDIEIYRGGNQRNGTYQEKSVTESTRGISAGGTGLSGNSNQNFGTASFIRHYDDNKATIIYLRLGCKGSTEIVENIRPLKRNITDIPRPLI
jgi:hypothetical protein